MKGYCEIIRLLVTFPGINPNATDSVIPENENDEAPKIGVSFCFLRLLFNMLKKETSVQPLKYY